MTPGEARWIYRLEDSLIEARVWCSAQEAAAFLELRVTAGPLRASFSSRISWRSAPTSSTRRASCRSMATEDGSAASRSRDPGRKAASRPLLRHCRRGARERRGARLGRAALCRRRSSRRPLCRDSNEAGAARGRHPARVPARGPGVAGRRGDSASGVGGRTGRCSRAGRPDATHGRTDDPAVARLDEILPWFAHNAGIHFSAPHGLEQYGGAAWGVRDVCQGVRRLAAGDR